MRSFSLRLPCRSFEMKQYAESRIEFAMKTNLPIEVDPEIMSGTPVFSGTRVPVQSLFEHLEDNVSLNQFLDFFPTVRREDAIAVLEHSKSGLLEAG